MNQAKIPNTITDSIADTLYIPLLMKRNETKRRIPFFKDPLACDLVDRLDYDFSIYDGAVQSSVGVGVRAKYFDEETEKFVLTHGGAVVVFVGCGLDTRYQRLGREVTGKTIFYELDIPEVMALREKVLPSSENDIYLKSSMFQTHWMDDLKEKHPHTSFLFVVEGVFMYFEKAQVQHFFIQLAQRFFDSKILFDVTSSWMCKNSYRHDTVKMAKAPFKFALDDDREIEAWATNLQLESVLHYGDFKEWKRAGFLRYFGMKMVPKIKKASRLLCYSIGDERK